MRSLPVVVVMLSLVWACLAWAPAARAGEWAQVTCTQPDGKPAPVEGWESVNRVDMTGRPSDTCEQSGGALTAFDSSIGEEETPYAGPMWVYTAPEGSKIAGGALTVSLLTPQGQAYVATPQNSFTSEASAGQLPVQHRILCQQWHRGNGADQTSRWHAVVHGGVLRRTDRRSQ